MLLTRAPALRTPPRRHLQKHPQAQAQLRKQRGARGCLQLAAHRRRQTWGTRGTIQAPLCITGVGKWQVPVQGDSLRSGRIRTSGVCLRRLHFHPFPKAKPSDELLLLRTGQHQSHTRSNGHRPFAISPGTPGTTQGHASTAADTDPSPSTASAKPAPRFAQLQTWVSPGWRCGKAKQCHRYCKATRDTGAGHKPLSKAGFRSPDWVFHSKAKQAVPPGCFLQAWHFASLLRSRPTDQNSLEGETPPRSRPGVPGCPVSTSPPARRVPPARSHTKPWRAKVPTAPRRSRGLGHTAPGWAAAGEMALRKRAALACSPSARLRRCSLWSHRPSKPAIPRGTIPGLKNGRKISLTRSWVWERAGASHADGANPPCGRSPGVAGNST